jgi:hypothetical protein
VRTTTRLTAVLATGLALAVPAAAQAASDGASKSFSDDEIFALTCGHLGVSCAPASHHRKPKARSARKAVRKARSVRRVRAHIALQPVQR